jgi:hypothetical protein
MGYVVQCYSSDVEQHHSFEIVFWEDERLLEIRKYISDGCCVAVLKPEIVGWLAQYDDKAEVLEDWYGCTINIYDDTVAMLFKMWWM